MGTTRPHATSSSETARARRSSRSACPWPGVPSRVGRSRDECLACQAPPFSCHRHCAPLRSGLASCAKQDQPPASMQAASPCTWAAAVCQHVCSKRNETRRARPLLAGRVRVCTEPKALAAGTAGTQADSPLPVGWEHVRRQSRRRRLTAKQGRVRRQAEQGMR